ncbi:MAG: lytic transglycosylase domain-containing protein [Bdellovibrionota bacterium]|jgi:hypothetical protein
MNKAWIHKNYRITPWENAGDATELFNDEERSSQSSSLTPLLTVLVFSSLILLLSIVFFSMNDSEEFIFAMADMPIVKGASLESFDKERVLARMSSRTRLDYNAKVDFIAKTIEKRNPSVDAKEIATMIVFQSHIANYDPLFVTAVIFAESNFKNKARSRVGARGLMQLMPDTARDVCKLTNTKWRGESGLDTPDYNIFLGINYLKFLSSEFYGNNLEHVLIAYNWGLGKFNRARSRSMFVRLPRETIHYKHKVLTHHKRWKAEFDVYLAALRRPNSESVMNG